MLRHVLLSLLLATALVGFVPMASACTQQTTPLVGIGEEDVGVFVREKSGDSWCGKEGWEQNCQQTLLSPQTTPASVTVPEIRVLGTVVVPQTIVPVPSVTTPGVGAPSRAADPECGVFYADAGVYADSHTWPNGSYFNSVGTDGCREGSSYIGLSAFVIHRTCSTLP